MTCVGFGQGEVLILHLMECFFVCFIVSKEANRTVIHERSGRLFPNTSISLTTLGVAEVSHSEVILKY